jgi:hypothetical protein
MPTARFFAILCFVFAATMHAQAASAGENARPNKVSFYFAAHEDDWQLFMNPSAFEDVVGSAKKTVFIHMTAGDAGLGVGNGGRKHPYYLARENGAENAIRFMADADTSPARRIVASHRRFNGHPIYRIAYRDTVSYFLRVADGNPHGGGYAHTGFQSLKRLAHGANNTLAAVDGSTVYHGWKDLVGTLRKIIDFERGRAAQVQLNVAETDADINPGDHSDHLMTAKAALDAVRDLACVRRVYYVDYASSDLPQNLDDKERDMESSVFAVTLAGVLALDQPTSWHHYDESYVGKNYFRVEDSGSLCSGATTELAAAKR